MRLIVRVLALMTFTAACDRPSPPNQPKLVPSTVARIEAATEAGRRFSRDDIFSQLKAWDSGVKRIDEVHFYIEDGVKILSIVLDSTNSVKEDHLYRLVYETQDERHFICRNAGDMSGSLGKPPDLIINAPDHPFLRVPCSRPISPAPASA